MGQLPVFSSLIAVDALRPLEKDWDALSTKSHGAKFRMALDEARRLLGREVLAGPVPPAAPKKEPEQEEETDGSEKDLPTNAFIVIDPETGEQTIHKRRGRPPKKRPEDFPAIQYKESRRRKLLAASASRKARRAFDLAKAVRLSKKLQKILLRPEIKAAELPIAQKILRLVFEKQRCTVEQVDSSKMGYVLVLAMRRRVWAPFPEMVRSFAVVLQTWKGLP